MKSFDSAFLERQKFPLSLVNMLHAIRESREKLQLERTRSPHLFKELARRQERARLKKSTRSSEEDIDYLKAIAAIRRRKGKLPFNLQMVLSLHKQVSALSESESGILKNKNNYIELTLKTGKALVPLVSARLCKSYLEQLHKKFDRAWKSKQFDPLILITAYVRDFFEIHPFFDGNGRVARLIFQHLLYQAGHDVGDYVHLENIIRKSKSGIDWKRGKHDLPLFCEYLAKTLLSAYRQVERDLARLK